MTYNVNVHSVQFWTGQVVLGVRLLVVHVDFVRQFRSILDHLHLFQAVEWLLRGIIVLSEFAVVLHTSSYRI